MFRKILQSIFAFILFFSILSPPMFTEKAYAYSSSPLLTIIPEKLQSTNMIEEGHRYTYHGPDHPDPQSSNARHIRPYIAERAVSRSDSDASKPYVRLRFFDAVQDANGNLYDLRVKITVQSATASNMNYFYWYKSSNRAEYGPFSYLANIEVPTAQASVWSNSESDYTNSNTQEHFLETSYDLEVVGATGRPSGYYSLYFGDIDQSTDGPAGKRATKEGLRFDSNSFSNITFGSDLVRSNEGWITTKYSYTANANIGDRSAAVTANANSIARF